MTSRSASPVVRWLHEGARWRQAELNPDAPEVIAAIDSFRPDEQIAGRIYRACAHVRRLNGAAALEELDIAERLADTTSADPILDWWMRHARGDAATGMLDEELAIRSYQSAIDVALSANLAPEWDRSVGSLLNCSRFFGRSTDVVNGMLAALQQRSSNETGEYFYLTIADTLIYVGHPDLAIALREWAMQQRRRRGIADYRDCRENARASFDLGDMSATEIWLDRVGQIAVECSVSPEEEALTLELVIRCAELAGDATELDRVADRLLALSPEANAAPNATVARGISARLRGDDEAALAHLSSVDAQQMHALDRQWLLDLQSSAYRACGLNVPESCAGQLEELAERLELDPRRVDVLIAAVREWQPSAFDWRPIDSRWITAVVADVDRATTRWQYLEGVPGRRASDDRLISDLRVLERMVSATIDRSAPTLIGAGSLCGQVRDSISAELGANSTARVIVGHTEDQVLATHVDLVHAVAVCVGIGMIDLVPSATTLTIETEAGAMHLSLDGPLAERADELRQAYFERARVVDDDLEARWWMALQGCIAELAARGHRFEFGPRQHGSGQRGLAAFSIGLTPDARESRSEHR